VSSASSTANDGQDGAAAATAVDQDEAMTMEVDDDEVPAPGQRVYCIACIELDIYSSLFLDVIIDVYTITS
jgi:hypothetical protein